MGRWIMAAPVSSIVALTPTSNLRDSVESSLSAAIVSGELSPGTLVSAPTLAAQFQVSATPVREAMLNLAKRGFVQPVRNKGFRVTSVSKKDLEELVQVRRWLEAPAMRIVASKLTGQPAEDFRLIADQITASAATSDFREYLAADAQFHLRLLELTGNGRLVELVSELRKQTRLVGLVTLSNSVELASSAREHHELLDLLVAGRGADAEKLAYKHIGHVIGWWAGLPEERPATT